MDVKIETEEFTDVYEIASEIGRGKFAVVKECRHKKNDRWFAAKKIRKTRKGVDCRSDALQEADMLKVTLSHPHFVDLIEVYESRHEMIIVTELMRGGELFQHITTEGQLDEVYTQTILRQVLCGLSFLHSKEIAHLDIKPQNILLTNQSLDCKVKLCDLGLARNVNHSDVFEIIGTPDYLAPEILDYQKLSVACDMWSTGVLVYVMLSGCSPFTGDTNQETYLNISQVNLDFPEEYFSAVSQLAIDFIQKLLIKDPNCRLKVDESLEHAWMANPCPPSPVEHEPVKRIRYEEDDHILSEGCSFNGLQNIPDSDDKTSHHTTHSPTIPSRSPIVVMKMTDSPVESVQKEIEKIEKRTQDSEKSKESFKSILVLRPTTPVLNFKALNNNNTPPTSSQQTLTSTSRSCIKLNICNPSPSSKNAPIKPYKATSISLEHQINVFTNPILSDNIDNIPNTDQIANIDNADNIDDLNTTESPTIHLSPSSPGSPKLQTSELTPHLSRAKFWKDSSTEPSGISV